MGKSRRLSEINILIVDDHSLFREGLHRILKDSDIKNIFEASNGEEAIITAESIKPDIILMDYHMPDMNGVEATRIILEKDPEIIVVLLTVNEEDEAIAEALNAGAQGYLNKNMRSTDIINSLRNLLQGKISLAKGLSNKELGDVLSISENTVKNHVRSILEKLEVKSRSHAVGKGLSYGVITNKDLL